MAVSSVVDPMFRLVQIVESQESSIFAHTRDLLLPKLISGEISVEAARNRSCCTKSHDLPRSRLRRHIEANAIGLFEELGWEVADCYHETLGHNSLLGPGDIRAVVLERRLRAALETESRHHPVSHRNGC